MTTTDWSTAFSQGSLQERKAGATSARVTSAATGTPQWGRVEGVTALSLWAVLSFTYILSLNSDSISLTVFYDHHRLELFCRDPLGTTSAIWPETVNQLWLPTVSPGHFSLFLSPCARANGEPGQFLPIPLWVMASFLVFFCVDHVAFCYSSFMEGTPVTLKVEYFFLS